MSPGPRQVSRGSPCRQATAFAGSSGTSHGIFGEPESRPGSTLLADSSGQPVRFVANAGQWAEGIDFVAKGEVLEISCDYCHRQYRIPPAKLVGLQVES